VQKSPHIYLKYLGILAVSKYPGFGQSQELVFVFLIHKIKKKSKEQVRHLQIILAYGRMN